MLHQNGKKKQFSCRQKGISILRSQQDHICTSLMLLAACLKNKLKWGNSPFPDYWLLRSKRERRITTLTYRQQQDRQLCYTSPPPIS